MEKDREKIENQFSNLNNDMTTKSEKLILKLKFLKNKVQQLQINSPISKSNTSNSASSFRIDELDS